MKQHRFWAWAALACMALALYTGPQAPLSVGSAARRDAWTRAVLHVPPGGHGRDAREPPPPNRTVRPRRAVSRRFGDQPGTRPFRALARTRDARRFAGTKAWNAAGFPARRAPTALPCATMARTRAPPRPGAGRTPRRAS